MTRQRADAFVFFGATGDLAKKKIYPSLYHLERKGRLGVPIVGVAAREWTLDEVRAYARDSITASVRTPDKAVLDALIGRISYVMGDYQHADTFTRLAEHLGRSKRALCYLAIPPSMFEAVARGLGAVGLSSSARVIVEKPFGRDLESCRALGTVLHGVFPERNIFHIDHYLGKEAIQNLLVFRFANSIIEPVWNRHYIRTVEITMAESFGIEGRGSFYDSVGALRDVVQNHLIEVISFLAMEPPVGDDAEAWRDEKVKVLKAMRAADPKKVVRGQYRGYRNEAGVADDSDVETFVALELRIDNWRWAGVPILVRAGKAMPTTATEAIVEFVGPPALLFADADKKPHPNQFRFRLGKNDGVSLHLQEKEPGPRLVSRDVALDVSHAEVFGERAEAYERLLGEAMDGDARFFARQDAVEEAWRVVEPVLRDPPRVVPYDPGTWGPAGSDALIAPYSSWDDPE